MAEIRETMESSDYRVIFVTTASASEAKVLAVHLLKERLVACINLVPKVTSLYWWQDKIEECREALMFIKTKEEKVEKVIEAVKRLNSYDVPEILVLPVHGGSVDYLRWIEASLVKAGRNSVECAAIEDASEDGCSGEGSEPVGAPAAR